VLKNLSTRWAWVGTAVHEAIEFVLRRMAGEGEGELLFEGPGLDPEHEIEAMTQGMRRQWRESRDALYRAFPKKRFGLSEHEYAERVSDDEWRATSQRAREALRSFFASDVFREIRETDPRTWFPIEEMGQFEFEGVPVWAVLDFAMRRPDGGAEIFDWKTGVPADANRLQLVCYALFMRSAHDVPIDRIACRLVYLGSSVDVRNVAMQTRDVDDARHAVRESIVAMRRRVRDLRNNVADREEFPMTDDLSKCAVCVFRRLCERG
jgi:CRISPR/Cas system-associated exonuclease Cas4 (RecB family)